MVGASGLFHRVRDPLVLSGRGDPLLPYRLCPDGTVAGLETARGGGASNGTINLPGREGRTAGRRGRGGSPNLRPGRVILVTGGRSREQT